MKLKKAKQATFSYPTKQSIKPLLWSVSTALVLSSCTQQVTPPSLVAGGMAGPLIGYPPNTPTKEAKPFHIEEKKLQPLPKKKAIEEPEVLGGVPPLPEK